MKKTKRFGSIIDLNLSVDFDNHIVNRASFFRMNPIFQKTSILIIDDETDICYLLSNILKQKNIRTVLASSLAEADNIIEHGAELSFIFLDNHLPDGLGVNYIKHIKEKCPWCKVIMITAHDNQAEREMASREGADHFIGKPFSRELILKVIDKLIA